MKAATDDDGVTNIGVVGVVWPYERMVVPTMMPMNPSGFGENIAEPLVCSLPSTAPSETVVMS